MSAWRPPWDEAKVRAHAEGCARGRARWPGDDLPALHVEWLVTRARSQHLWREAAALLDRAANLVGMGRQVDVTEAQVLDAMRAAARADRAYRDAHRAYRHSDECARDPRTVTRRA